MQDLPDAPYIREAEMNGAPSCEPVVCPVCGEECDTVYLQGGTVIGCERCIEEKDAYEWAQDQKGDEI